MKYDTIIVSLLCESDEVLDCLRCYIWIELEGDITVIGGEENARIGHDEESYQLAVCSDLRGI